MPAHHYAGFRFILHTLRNLEKLQFVVFLFKADFRWHRLIKRFAVGESGHEVVLFLWRFFDGEEDLLEVLVADVAVSYNEFTDWQGYA